MTVDNPLPEQNRRSSWLQAMGLAALDSVPVLGSAAASLISESIRQVAREKDEEWAAMVVARLRAIEQGGVQIDTTAPEFVAALRRLSNAAAETADAEKLALLARAAANAGPWSPTPLPQREEYVSLVTTLTPTHVRALALVDAAQEIPGPSDGGQPAMTFPEFAAELGDDRPLAQRLLIALQQRGLLGSPLAGVSGATSIEITRFGAGFMRFLGENGTSAD